MTYEVRISLKEGLLDPAAITIENALVRLNFAEVKGLKTGKLFFIEVENGTPVARIEEMCQKLLANPVMEHYEIREVAQ